MSNVSIVLAKQEHWEDIVDIIVVAAEDSGRSNNRHFDRQALLNYIKFLDTTFGNKICGILAYRDGKPIGYISAMIMPPMSGMSYFLISFISFFWVLKEERGTQIGRALIEGLKRWSVNRKAKEIHLQVTSSIEPTRTHKMLLSGGSHSYGVNYILQRPFDIPLMPSIEEKIEVVEFTCDDDLNVIADLVVASVKEGIHRERQFNVAEYIEEMRKALKRDSNQVLFLAKRDNKPVGYAVGKIEKGIAMQDFRFCNISHFYVTPEEAQSVEMHMVEHMVNWAKTKALDEMTIFIFGHKRTVQIGETLKQAGFTLAGGNYVLPLIQKEENITRSM